MSTTTTQIEGLLIDGERVDASDGQTFDVFDPSTGERLATVAKATKAEELGIPTIDEAAFTKLLETGELP